MLIEDWMAKNVLTVDENTSLMRATRIMKENNIRRLPVVSHGKLIGIVTDRDVKDASPSKTATLDIHELYYLLSEMKVKDVMTASPLTLKGKDSLELAAVIMLEDKISGLPVVDESGRLTGLLSETDLLRAFVRSTGIKDGSRRYVFDLPDAAGSVTRVMESLRQYDARVISILTSFEDAPEGQKRVSIRITMDDAARAEELHQDLLAKFTVVDFGIDDIKNRPRKKQS
ncbi:CBS and ACT domain-containing protein [Desulfurivibrio alkaliphilus]|uniref:CBS domain containing membrane protein n=1 Tax=Desulfurivibrio alkaliphilus (strain DSM 19089 / UNIQEM U267 / AHT2) TaxID=589865 RepID=D6Z6J7_DESAT|nr:CBS and ACT domain-containing protein [Desulfurivibrio alkaliphilus]ADH84956.1 CBS domain containing membrane protein [Desulfurivibrio alkaliphilus AHT 2]